MVVGALVRVQRGASARSGSGSSRWVPVWVPVWGWLLGLGCFVTGHQASPYRLTGYRLQATGHRPPARGTARAAGGRGGRCGGRYSGEVEGGGYKCVVEQQDLFSNPGVPLVYCGYRLCEKSFATSVRRHWSLHFSSVGAVGSGCCSGCCSAAVVTAQWLLQWDGMDAVDAFRAMSEPARGCTEAYRPVAAAQRNSAGRWWRLTMTMTMMEMEMEMKPSPS